MVRDCEEARGEPPYLRASVSGGVSDGARCTTPFLTEGRMPEPTQTLSPGLKKEAAPVDRGITVEPPGAPKGSFPMRVAFVSAPLGQRMDQVWAHERGSGFNVHQPSSCTVAGARCELWDATTDVRILITY